MMQAAVYDVFLSHNSADKSLVEQIARRLVDEAKLQPFLDKWHLVPGVEWQTELEDALRRSKTVAVFIGKSGNGPWHHEEMQVALKRAVREKHEFRVIPVLLPGADTSSMSEFLQLRTWVDFSAGTNNDIALKRLVAGILGQASEFEGITLPDDPAPYRGLLQFKPEHARFFFGREQDIGPTKDKPNLIDKLRTQRFVAVVGSSGSGKSSIVGAGLLPRLAQNVIAGSRHWRTVTFTPADDPWRSLAVALAGSQPPEKRGAIVNELMLQFEEPQSGLRHTLLSWFADTTEPLLLFIDQFEELFTHAPSAGNNPAAYAIYEERMGGFLRQLAHEVLRPDGRLRVVITVRADFMPHCLRMPELKGLLQDRQLLLGELATDEAALREVIQRPAQEVGALLETGLMEVLLADVRHQTGALPLLEHALSELWRKRRGPWLTLAAYQASGGVSGALEQRAEETLQRLTEPQQHIARRIFVKLTSLEDDTANTRRRVDRKALYAETTASAEIDAVINILAGPDARLVVADAEALSIAHEALIQNWPRLRMWLDADRQLERIHRELEDAANQWAEMGRGNHPLGHTTAVHLAETAQYAAGLADRTTALEREFLTACRQEQELVQTAEELRRQRELAATQKAARLATGLASGAAVAALVFMALFWYAMDMKWEAEAQTAIANSKTMEANQLVEETRRQQYLSDVSLASEAGQDGHHTRMRELLERHTWVSRRPELQGLEELRDFEWYYLWRVCHSRQTPLSGQQGAVTALAFSPVRPLVASAGEDRIIRLWDLATRPYHLVANLPGHAQPLTSLAFSGDGRWLASGSLEGVTKVWDVQTEQALAEHAGEGPVNCLHFQAGGSRLAIGCGPAKEGGGAVVVRDWKANTELFRHAAQDSIRQVAFIPGQKKLVAVVGDSHRIQIHDSETGTVIETREALGPRSILALSPDGSLLAIAAERQAQVVATDTFQEKFTFHSTRPFRKIAFSSNSKLITAFQEGGLCSTWDVNGKEIDKLEKGLPQEITSLSLFAKDELGRADLRIIWGTADANIGVWDRAPEKRLQFQWKHERDGQNGDLSVGFSPNGYHVVTACRYANSPQPGVAPVDFRVEVKVWDVAAERIIYECADLQTDLQPLALNVGGKLFAGVRSNGIVEIWDLKQQQLTQTIDTQAEAVRAVEFMQDDRQLATLDGQGRVRLWDHTTGKLIRSFGELGSGTALAINDGGTRIAAADQENVRVWDFHSGQVIHELKALVAPIKHLAFQAGDSELVVIGRPGKSEVWNLRTKMRSFDSQGLMSQGYEQWPDEVLASSPSGTRLATAVLSGKIKLWDLRTGQELLTLERPEGFVAALAFSPGSRLLVAGFENGTVQLWRAASDAEVQEDSP